MSNWQPRHEIIWVALGNDEDNTFMGWADSYEEILKVAGDFYNKHPSWKDKITHYLREYSEREKDEPTHEHVYRCIDCEEIRP